MFRLELAFLFLTTSFTSMAQEDYSKVPFYVSSMDQDHGSGIALYELDFMTGDMKFLGESDIEPNSDYLTISPDGQYLYSVVQEPGSDSGLVTSFSINRTSGELTYLDEEYTRGYGPCHITTDKKGDYLVVAHYDGGSVSVLSALSDGNLGSVRQTIFHQGSSVVKDRQEKPHPHMACISPKGRYVLVSDLGIDKIMCYRLKSNGKLKPTSQTGINMEPGSGPRHIVFHPSGKFAYVVNELNSTVTAFSFDKSNGSMQIIENVRSIPEDFHEPNYLADVHISRDGNYLYASNRGYNSISIFKIDQNNGKIELIENTSCGGDWPRAFNICPTGHYLLVANERSDNIVVFEIEPSTGLLTKKSESKDFPAPRCIKFLNIYH